MKKINISFLVLCSLAALLFIACTTSDEPGQVLNMKITESNDSLLTFDSLIVTVHSQDGKFSQEVFHGVLRDPKQVASMGLDPRVGKDYTVSIVGYRDGKIGVNKEVTFVGNGAQSKDVPIHIDKPETVVVAPELPDILAPSDTSVMEGDSLGFRVTVRNPWNNPTIFTLKDAIPGAALDTAGRNPGDGYFTWRPSFDQGRTEPYAVTFVYAVTDKKVEKITRVKVLNLNRPPKLAAILDQKAQENETLSFKVDATDPDHDSITLTATGLPEGASFSVGTFTWKPDVGQAGNYPVRFRAFDGIDSDLVAVLITVGNVDIPPEVELKITSPTRDTTVNFTPITILYTVNGEPFQRKVALKDGQTKVFIDTTIRGRTALDTITITLDTVPPGKPVVTGASPVRSRTPTWTWTSGVGGSGTYRYRLDVEDMSGSTLLTETSYTASKDLDPGTHTLFVQERDVAENWSPTGKATVRIDTTRPAPPTVSVDPSPTLNVQPIWNWQGVDDDLNGLFRHKLDNADLRIGALETRNTSFTPKAGEGLSEGPHTLYVQQQDSAGNWSNSGNALIRIDLTPPNAPQVKTVQASPTNITKPVWSWTSGGNGGLNIFRVKLGDSILTTGAVTGAALTFTPDTDLKDGTHTLYVQERDSAGNWSRLAAHAVRVDLTPPAAPKVSTASLKTTSLKPTWTWHSGGNGGIGNYRYKLNDTTMASGTLTTDTNYIPGSPMSEGLHTLHIQEMDSAGNWSAAGSLALRIRGLTGYAAGGGGNLVKTTDGGENWRKLATGTSAALGPIFFTHKDTGFVCGSDGFILKTVDGGANWTTRGSGTSQPLKSLNFVNTMNGFAVGEGGFFAKTTNGGESWLPRGTQFSVPLNSVFFTDVNTGYTVGGGSDGGVIASTKNGGESWSAQYQVTSGELASVYFTDANVGFATAATSILKTANGGNTWSPISIQDSSYYTFTAIHFPSPNVGFIVSILGSLLKTIDGGRTWNSTTATPNHNSSIFFTDSSTGIITSTDLYKSTDGGESWKLTNIIGDTGGAYWNSVFFP